MANQINGFTVVAYPESMPSNWATELDKLPFGYCSALHDKDINEETGQLKKAHMHFFFQGNPSKSQKEYIYASLGISYGEVVRNASAMYDYLTHEDKPEKYHYSRDIINVSRKWCQEIFDLHYTPKVDTTAELIRFIEENAIDEYRDLMIELAKMSRDDLIKEAQKYWVMRYVDSRRFATNGDERSNKR